jgi:5-amino-6-(5-phosphoribosylamino)uracil reductase
VRPYTILSASMSIDGYLDAPAVARLPLSNAADLDRVDAVRAECDAILVGARTVRNDNPRLLVRSPERRAARLQQGRPASPAKVTLTTAGNLDPQAHFFRNGVSEKYVYGPEPVAADPAARLGTEATVIGSGHRVELSRVTADLHDRGVRRLMVEGGGTVHTQFLTQDLADELQLVVAPFFVGDSRAIRFVGDGAFPWTSNRRAALAQVRTIGDVVLLRYRLSDRFDDADRR